MAIDYHQTHHSQYHYPVTIQRRRDPFTSRTLTHLPHINWKFIQCSMQVNLWWKIVNIKSKGRSILKVWRDWQTRFCSLPLHKCLTRKQSLFIEPTKQADKVGQTKNFPNLIKYLHAAAFSPFSSTCIAEIGKYFFQSWPGLTEESVQKHLPKI